MTRRRELTGVDRETGDKNDHDHPGVMRVQSVKSQVKQNLSWVREGGKI